MVLHLSKATVVPRQISSYTLGLQDDVTRHGNWGEYSDTPGKDSG